MNFKALACGCLLVSAASAADISGRYRGVASGKKPDGTGPEIGIFLILRQEGSKLSCSGDVESFERQIPCEDPVLIGDEVKFAMPWGGGVLFELKAQGKQLTGTLHSKAGIPAAPFDTVTLNRVGDLTLSDRVPRLIWEGDERSPRLLELRKSLFEGQNVALQEFWNAIEKSGSPLVEPLPNSDSGFLVTFVWKGAPETRSVLLIWPRMSFARPDNYFLSHVEGTDLWFKTLKVRRGMRIYYQLSPNDPLEQRPEGKWLRKAQADTLNPNRESKDPKIPLERTRSLLELPGALPQPWYVKRSNVPHYSSAENKVRSEHLKSERKVLVYTPPGFSMQHEPYASIYLTDGEDPDGLVFATWTFENLLADGKIPPTVVVRIVNPDQEARNRELACSDPLFKYLTDELVPFIRQHYNTSRDPSKTAIGGYSLGGVAGAYAGLRYSGTFGLILSQSGSYWFEPTRADYAEPNWLARQFAASEKLPLRFYMDAGTNEVDLNGGGGILVTNRQLRDVLKAKGYEVYYQEFAGDHDYVNWRGTLADGLIALLGHLQR